MADEKAQHYFWFYFIHLLVQTFSMMIAAVVCIVTKTVFYTSLRMGAVIFWLKQGIVQPRMSSFKPQCCLYPCEVELPNFAG